MPSLCLHSNPLAPTSHRNNVEQRKEHWTRKELNLLAQELSFFLNSVTLETSLNLSESFSFLMYKVGIIAVFPDQNVVFLSNSQSLKCYCLYHCHDFLVGVLGTEVTPSFVLTICSPRLITHSGAKVMPSQQFRVSYPLKTMMGYSHYS